ncbi:MAG: C40 family peptidase [Gemmatimonadaceae bacterium]|nr:C40 family peptidase [Gemmatimonadaceae bacterium]
MRIHLAPSTRSTRALRAASLALAAALLWVPAVRAQDPEPVAASRTSIAVPGSKLSHLLDAAATTDGPKPFARFTASADAMRDSIVALARAQIGTPYVRGGASPERGFDCSGLVKYVLGLLDISAPRTARLQARIGEAVPRDTSELRPGDLLTFGRSKQGASHVAIYVGDGRYVHASVTAGRVIETTFDRRNEALVRVWRGVRRIFEPVADSVKKGEG